MLKSTETFSLPVRMRVLYFNPTFLPSNREKEHPTITHTVVPSANLFQLNPFILPSSCSTSERLETAEFSRTTVPSQFQVFPSQEHMPPPNLT